MKKMKWINKPHLMKHGLTLEDFIKIYPNAELKSKDLINQIKTDNNKRSSILKELNTKIKLVEYNKVEHKCKFCKADIPFNKSKKIFCNASCAASYNNVGRHVKYKYSEEGLKNLREIGKINIQNTRKPKQIYQLVCKVCSKIFERGSTGKNNKTCSVECKKIAHSLYNFKSGQTFGKAGYYKGVYCSSSWELAFLIKNLDLGHEVIRCELIFEYEYQGKISRYFPDFIMNNIIYEIKGYEKEEVKCKTEAVIKAGYEIIILREKEIFPIVREIRKTYKVKDITELYDKKFEAKRPKTKQIMKK